MTRDLLILAVLFFLLAVLIVVISSALFATDSRSAIVDSKNITPEWEGVYRCYHCGYISKYSHRCAPCRRCGNTSYDEFTARSSNRKTWEFHEGKVPPPPRMPEYNGSDAFTVSKRDAKVVELLRMQQLIIDHVPNDWEVKLVDHKVLVKPPAPKPEGLVGRLISKITSKSSQS